MVQPTGCIRKQLTDVVLVMDFFGARSEPTLLLQSDCVDD